MRILVTNDDGIDATGLSCLETIAGELSDEVWVVAPATEQSAKGHSISLRDPVRLRSHGERRYSVDGTPADCVMMGIRHVMAEGGVDLVLSGINRGANVADDVTYSGTVAAAMEATLLGVPAIALSQEYRQGQHDFSLQKPQKRTDPFGRDYFWLAGWGLNVEEAPEGTDLHALINNRIAVTPIHLDMTHDTTLERLAGAFA